jgi:hypothetical protein
VIDKETFPDPGSRMNLYSGKKPGDLRKESGDKGYFKSPEEMSEAMNENGMKPRIEQKFQISYCGIISVYRLDILDNGKHPKLLSFSIDEPISFFYNPIRIL